MAIETGSSHVRIFPIILRCDEGERKVKKKRADINRLVCCDLELSLQSLPAIRIIIFLLF